MPVSHAMLPDDKVQLIATDYGKNYVKLLYVTRQEHFHHIKEIEVSTALTLSDHEDYIHADNSKIIATDSQKNTVYIVAKLKGISSIEQFAIDLSAHFLTKYPQVISTKIHIEQAPWVRINLDGKEHVHAFMNSSECNRYCNIEQKKNSPPSVSSGFNGMKILKTTKSSFTNFVKDEFRSLPDMDDRIFCTIVDARWWYNSYPSSDFDRVWKTVKDLVIATFTGPADTGILSRSVQNTLYIAAKKILAQMPQIDKLEIELPNVHAYKVELSRFPAFGFTDNNEVYQPTDKPSGNIRACLQRTQQARL